MGTEVGDITLDQWDAHRHAKTAAALSHAEQTDDQGWSVYPGSAGADCFVEPVEDDGGGVGEIAELAVGVGTVFGAEDVATDWSG